MTRATDIAIGPSAGEAVGGSRRQLRPWRPGTSVMVVPVLILLGVVFVYPTSIFLLRAFTHFNPPQVAGLDNLVWFLGDETNRIILVRTFTVASMCAVLTAIVAFPYAYCMTVIGPRGRTIMLGVLLLSMFLGILLRNFAWVILLQYQGPLNDILDAIGLDRIRFLGTAPAVVMGMMHILFPFMVLPLYSVLNGIDRRLVLAAQSMGATPMRAFRQVYLPLAMPGIIAGALLVFVLALGFFITPALLGSPRQALMSQLMFLQFDLQAAFGRAGAMAVVLLIIAMVFVILSNIVQRRSRAYGDAS